MSDGREYPESSAQKEEKEFSCTSMGTERDQQKKQPQTTILIPHFQTLDPIRLCLRSLRKYTREPVIVRVLDNGSKDASLEYLRSVRWIELVETGIANDAWKAHYQSLNQALADVRTPYFVVMHTDTYVHNHHWLEFLVEQLELTGSVAVGSRHQRIPVRTKRWLIASLFRDLRRREWKPGVPILRSLCALYKTDVFLKENCTFITHHGEDITYEANEQLVQRGHRVLGLSSRILSRYLFHASAQTQIQNHMPQIHVSSNPTPALHGQSYITPRIHRRSTLFQDQFLQLAKTKALLNDQVLDQ
jgi:glycosyltransferase involved in cell wall biosynthesis